MHLAHALLLAALSLVTFKTTDGVTVYADVSAVKAGAPVVLLFHQAGSSKGEYASIAPKLNALGFTTIAIDQRSGGPMFGENQTAAAYGKSATYLEVLPDLQATLDYARTRFPDSRIILWGSSYSSDLVLLLAAKHPAQIAGVLSFSPDASYLGDPSLVMDAARKIRAPLLIVSGPGEGAAGKAILDAAPSSRKEQFVPKVGVHGSSTLIPARNPQGAQANWESVAAFLQTLRS